MFAAFGSKVIVLENTTEFLSREDRTIAEAVRKVMENQGIEFHFSIEMQSIQDTDEETVVTYRDTTDKTEHSLFANAVLVATGRQPNTESLDPGVAGIHLNEHGAIIVNEYLQTTASDIWALGDVNNSPIFPRTITGLSGINCSVKAAGPLSTGNLSYIRYLSIHLYPASV